jgi:uncharacterized protein
MPHAPNKSITHPSPRSPLVFDIRTLSRQPGSARSENRIVPAPADLHVALARVPVGADVKLSVKLEAVMEGVLVTAEVAAPVAGECARCLEPLTTSVDASFQELYETSDGRADEDDDEDRRFLDADLLNLEPDFRDAVVLALPLAPLCRSDCEGLCPDCGIRLAEAGPDHGHGEATDPRWARLRQLNIPDSSDNEDGARAAETQEG